MRLGRIPPGCVAPLAAYSTLQTEAPRVLEQVDHVEKRQVRQRVVKDPGVRDKNRALVWTLDLLPERVGRVSDEAKVLGHGSVERDPLPATVILSDTDAFGIDTLPEVEAVRCLLEGSEAVRALRKRDAGDVGRE